MKSFCFRTKFIRLAVMFTLSIVGQPQLHAETPDHLSAGAVIQKAITRAQQDNTRSETPDFNYTKFTVTEELDGAGRVKDRKEKVYDVAYRGGQSHVNLVAVNGQTPTSDDRTKKSGNEINLQQLLGQAKSGKGDNFLSPELAARFDFRFVNQTNVDGRQTYQIAFEPKKPELPANTMAERVLNRVSGTLWIDSTEFEVAQAQVFLKSEVNLLGGIAGTLKKLAYTLVRTRIADGIWFSTLSSGDIQGRKLLDSTHIKTKSHSVNFRPVAIN